MIFTKQQLIMKTNSTEKPHHIASIHQSLRGWVASVQCLMQEGHYQLESHAPNSTPRAFPTLNDAIAFCTAFGCDISDIKISLPSQDEHAALVAVAEAAKQIPSVPDIAVHWTKIIEPALANLAAVREGKASV